ncbi:hypothetical protein [Actinophytocola oryzae]|uniref:Excreted virulence factor EspC (Type VII ESX diderm) n=1 Tax=Actinophytocola oryzae TaxID=502181 RepID=A0A4R7VNV4_9PSEU|nr:hypothetical protein [Actinophytocola oryzae]TDV51045.1 hypothetical protein CLV71_106396 [Actinophytocola oryzae]
MGFFVRPEALDSYAKLVERNGINLSLTNVHLGGESRLENTDGVWIQHLLDAHTETVDRILTSLAQGFNQMGASADELARTASYYRSVDQTQAARLDATFVASPRPPLGAPGPVSTQRPGEQGPTEAIAGDDIRNPLTHLTEPGDPSDFSDPLALFNTLGDYPSPTWWINQVLDDTIGVNPMEYVNQLVIGDWKGFARCGTMWAQLAGAADDIGDNLDNGLRWLAADWQGKAGDAATYYFDYAGKALHSHADVFRVLHNKYVDIARHVWLCSKTLADIIKAIMDTAFVAGLAVLAGTSLSWTGVGAGISWSVAAWECSQILKLWGEATAAISEIQMAITGFVGMATSPDGVTLREITPLPMPVVDYDHPGVAPEPARPRQKGEL